MIAVTFYVEDDSTSSAETARTTYDQALNAAKIDRIRDRLGVELADVRRGLAEVWTGQALSACAGRYNASVDHIAAGKLASQLYDSLQQRRSQILSTLGRIRDGEFGNCASCGDTIPYHQLEISPETVSCVGCSQ